MLLEYPETSSVDVHRSGARTVGENQWLSVKAVRDECERLKAVRYPPLRVNHARSSADRDEERERRAQFRRVGQRPGRARPVIIEDGEAAKRGFEGCENQQLVRSFSDEALGNPRRARQGMGSMTTLGPPGMIRPEFCTGAGWDSIAL